MSQAGCSGGRALADVLTGKVTPSGHLTTTWAENYADYPNAETFSYLSGDVNDEYYHEGIYVGYRYFDSFGVAPAYPFGFGLSYTDFAMKCKSCTLDGETVMVTAEIQNIGTQYSGKETVQVYVSQPQGKLDKPYQILAGYAKTKLLAPGAAEVLTISIPLRELASYDEEKAQYVLEPGKYYIRVGSHSRDTHIACAIAISETVVTKQLANKLTADCDLKVLKADGSLFYSYPAEAAEKEAAPVIAVPSGMLVTETVTYAVEPSEFHTDREAAITMQDVLVGKTTLDELTAQLTPAELAALVIGSARRGVGQNSTIGAASSACPGAAGDTTSDLIESHGVLNISLADGPAGLRLDKSFVTDGNNNLIPGLGESAMGNLPQLLGTPVPERPADAVDHYQCCTAIPIATLLAQTWDVGLIAEAGDIVGEEME